MNLDCHSCFNDDLHWLDVPQRVLYKLAVTVHRFLRNQAPTYLADHCVPVSDVVAGRRHLRPAARHQWLYHVSVAAPLVLVPSLLLVPQFGIHLFYCLTICVIQLWSQSSFDMTWKRIWRFENIVFVDVRLFMSRIEFEQTHTRRMGPVSAAGSANFIPLLT